jgi:hypothetical protein
MCVIPHLVFWSQIPREGQRRQLCTSWSENEALERLKSATLKKRKKAYKQTLYI